MDLARGGTIVLKGQPVCQLEANAESCLIFAAANGVVVHPSLPNPSGAPPVSESGAIVEQCREIFTVVDDTGPMQVDVKVSENVIDQIERGLKARIWIDALPRESLTGIVGEVAVLPDSVAAEASRKPGARERLKARNQGGVDSSFGETARSAPAPVDGGAAIEVRY